MPSPRQRRGSEAEDRAQALIEAQGLRVEARNFRCRSGEIDIVAQDGDTLVFVEVRSRSHDRQGGAAASVDLRKQRRLIRAAEYYLLRHPDQRHRPCRFDVIALDADRDANWIRNAFQVYSP